MSRGAERSAVLSALLLYVVGFAVLPPRVLSVADEAYYVRQAQAFARGVSTVEARDPLTGERARVLPSTYPVGTSALQTPFVWLGGWRAAAAASVLSLVMTVLVLLRWLEGAGRSPLFALVVLGFMPALVLGRIAMSDTPSMAAATLGLYFFFRSNGESRRDWLVAGLLAGGSLLFRETNVLLFVPLFVGAVLRRERNWTALLVGALLGAALRPLTALVITGNPFFIRPTHAHLLDFADATRNAALYGTVLMTLVPGGLAAVVAYRGPRRPELITTVLLYTAFYSTYEYGGWESSWQKQLVLGPRFFLPLLPLLVWAMADTFSRWRVRGIRAPLARTLRALWIAVVLGSVVMAHWMVDRWGRSQQAIVSALYGNTTPGAAVVIDPMALGKYANEVYGDRTVLSWDDVAPEQMARVRGVYPSLQVALLYRSDSDYWVQRGSDGDRYVRGVAARCHLELIHDTAHTATDRLRVWDVVSCDSHDATK